MYYFGNKERIFRVNKTFEEKAVCLTFWNVHKICPEDVIITNRIVSLLLYWVRLLKKRPLLVYVSDGLISPLLQGRDRKLILESSIFDFVIFNQPYLNIDQIKYHRPYVNSIKAYTTYINATPIGEKNINLILPNNPYLSCNNFDYLNTLEAEFIESKFSTLTITAKSRISKKLANFIRSQATFHVTVADNLEHSDSKKDEFFVLSGASSTFLFLKNCNIKFICTPEYLEYFTPNRGAYSRYHYNYLESEILMLKIRNAEKYYDHISFATYLKKISFRFVLMEVFLLLGVKK